MITSRDIPYYLENFLEEKRNKRFRALSTVVRYEKDGDGNNTEIVKDCGITVRVVGGFRHNVYLPKECLEDVQKLKTMIDSGSIVYIKPIKFIAKGFAIKGSDDSIIASVSMKAANFEVVSTEEVAFDDFDDIIE